MDAAIRAALRPDNPERIAAIRAQELDLAQTLASRNVGWRILAGDIQVKLKPHRL